MENPATLAIVLASVVAVFYIAVIAYVIVQIARTRELSEVEKGVWIIAVLCAPLLGALVWYFAGPHPFGFRLTRQVR